MKVLVWHSANGDVYYAGSTPEQLEASYRALFKEMDEQGDYESCPPENGQEPYYEQAKQGVAGAAKKFLTIRSGRDYEYEGISVEKVIDPLVEAV